MPLIEKSLEKFGALDPELILTVDSEETSLWIEEVAQKYNISTGVLSLALIFHMAGDLAIEDLPGYFQHETSLGEKMSAEIAASFQKSVLDRLVKRLSFLNSDPDKPADLSKEKEMLSEIMGRKLILELNNHPIIANAVNFRIFNALSQDLDFKEELSKALLANEEVLTSKPFLLEKKPASPTIANWIKDFIQDKGSALFDTIVLSNFLTNSKNVRVLDEGEKELVRKVLLLYRNLKFFSASMPENDEEWQIIPFDFKDIEPPEEEAEDLTPEEAIAELDRLKVELDRQKAALDEEKRKLTGEPAPVPVKTDRLEELKEAVGKYPAGSLERLAVEEEIKKLEK